MFLQEENLWSYVQSESFVGIYSCRSTSLDDRVTEVLSWFDGDPTTFPDLVMLYFEQPDSAGHAQGPFGDYVSICGLL